MKSNGKTIEFKFERIIPASPAEVFDGWLDPKVPGNPWNISDKLLLNPEVDGFFYWNYKGQPHYGRFTEVERPGRIRHTWVSPSTSGLETTVTLTFEKKGSDTLMTLMHTDLPDTDGGRGHEKGWNYFLGMFSEQLAKISRK